MTTKAGLFTGGTTGLRDGTLVSIGGAAPLTFPALNTVLTCHVRQLDDTTLVDTGEDSATNVMLIPRVGESISANNSDWTTGDGTTPFDLGVKLTGGNQPVYLKQTGSASGALRINPLSFVAGTRLTVGTVTPTASAGQVSLAFTDVAETSYDVYHSTSSTPPAHGVAATITGATYASGAIVVTGLAAGLRYFWVRGNSALGAGTWSTGVSATVTAAPHLVDSYQLATTVVAGIALITHDNTTGLDAIGQSFTGDGSNLTSAKFPLTKVGTPTGDFVAKLYAHTGTFGTTGLPTGSALATSSAVNCSALTTNPTWAIHTFTFDGTYTLVNGTKYVIVVDGSGLTTDAAKLTYGAYLPSSSHAGRAMIRNKGTQAWAVTATSTDDLQFEVYGQ